DVYKRQGWGNAAFLIERFEKEKSIHVKRALVWLMRFSRQPEEVLEMCTRYYRISDKIVQKAMRETLLHIGVSEQEFFNKLK
ncbi:MAG: hypothetical protein N2316_05780, partial [Spirochaetes bacterium]|nr:hypothetical protein [Spirochaetota bacterium]